MKNHTTKNDRSTWSSPNPAEPVLVSRCAIYAPITRISPNGSRSALQKRSSETQWGRVDSSGPILTWEHRRIELLAKLRAKESRKWENGSLSVWIDAYELKKELGYDNGGEDHRRFLQRLRDLKTANLVTRNNRTGEITESSILWSFSYDQDKPDDQIKPGAFTTAKGAVLFEILYSKEYMEFLSSDLRIHCDPLIPDLVQIKDGLIASVIMFFLTMQDTCQYKILNVLDIVGAVLRETSKVTVSRLVKKLKTTKDFEQFGITVSGDCLVYERNQKVFFTNHPPQTSTCVVIDSKPSKKPALAGKVDKITSESPDDYIRIPGKRAFSIEALKA